MTMIGIRVHRPATQPLLSEDSSFDFEIATESLKWYKEPGTSQISADLIQEGGENYFLAHISL
jgi:hypothetical protein